MSQSPLQADAIQIEPSSGDTLLISRDPTTGGILFTDPNFPSGVNLSDVGALGISNNIYQVGINEGEYTTIQSALDAIPSTSSPSNPHVVLVGPGVYNEALTWNKDGVCLVGVGCVTITSNSTYTITIEQNGALIPTKATLFNVHVQNTNATLFFHGPLTVVGGSGSTVGSDLIHIVSCELEVTEGNLGRPLNASTVNNILVQGCDISKSPLLSKVYVENCASFVMQGTNGVREFNLTYNGTVDEPSISTEGNYTISDVYGVAGEGGFDVIMILNSQGSAEFNSCLINNFTFSGAGSQTCDLNFCHIQGALTIGANVIARLNSTFKPSTATVSGTLVENPVARGSLVGDILYWDGSVWAVLPPGTATQILQTNGSGSPPAWVNASAGSVPDGTAHGDVLYWNGSAWTLLAPGTDGQHLRTQGSGSPPLWEDPPAGNVPDGTIGGQILFWNSGTVAWDTVAPLTPGQVLTTQGPGNPPAWGAGLVSGSNVGDILTWSGASTWSSVSPGTSGQILQTNGIGSSPTWVNPPTVVNAGAATGDILFWDNTGGEWVVLSAGLATQLLQANGSGVAPSWVNPPAGSVPSGSTQGDILYWSGVAWTILPPGTSGEFLKTQGGGANPVWDTPAGGGGSSVLGANIYISSVSVGGPAPGVILTGWVANGPLVTSGDVSIVVVGGGEYIAFHTPGTYRLTAKASIQVGAVSGVMNFQFYTDTASNAFDDVAITPSGGTPSSAVEASRAFDDSAVPSGFSPVEHIKLHSDGILVFNSTDISSPASPFRTYYRWENSALAGTLPFPMSMVIAKLA
jgi:hypothetical protein